MLPRLELSRTNTADGLSRWSIMCLLFLRSDPDMGLIDSLSSIIRLERLVKLVAIGGGY